MNLYRSVQRQQGAVLVVGMIMLVLITLMVASAFTLSNSNMKSVGNMQFRNEAIASANKAIEETISSWTWNTTFPVNDINVDIDNDNNIDYVVTMAAPTCIRSSAVTPPDVGGSETPPNEDGTFTTTSPAASVSNYNIVVNITATVANKSTGAQVLMRQGISRTVTQTQCNSICAPPISSGLCG